MLNTNSIWTNIASITVGCVILASLALLFVRASNIERRWVVSLTTLCSSLFALYLMAKDAQFVPGRELPTSIAAIALSILGFFIGRAIDVAMGERNASRGNQDKALSNVELAD